MDFSRSIQQLCDWRDQGAGPKATIESCALILRVLYKDFSLGGRRRRGGLFYPSSICVTSSKGCHTLQVSLLPKVKHGIEQSKPCHPTPSPNPCCDIDDSNHPCPRHCGWHPAPPGHSMGVGLSCRCSPRPLDLMMKPCTDGAGPGPCRAVLVNMKYADQCFCC